MRIRTSTLPLVFLALSAVSWAALPRFWENFTREEMLAGVFSGVSLASDGALSLAPPLDLWFDTGQEYIFSMVRDRAGNLYVGTGAEGKVYRIDPEGKGSLYFESRELHVFALALDSSGTLYAGTSPEGRIYRLRGANDPEEFFDPEGTYIWAMVFDAEDNLYVGTGAGGVIYRVNREGQGTVFHVSGDSHVRCLRFEGKDLLAGTAPNGRVLRVDRRGRGFALVDTPYEEVHALAMDRFGTLYAAAASSKAPGSAPASAGEGVVTVSTTVTVVAGAGGAGSAPAAAGQGAGTATEGGEGRKRSGAAAVYAIGADGAVELLYSADGETAFDIVPGADGELQVATGPKGRLMTLRSGGRVAVVTDLPEEDASRLIVAGDDVYVGTINRGKVYRLRKGKAPSGTFESDTLDAGTVSTWGRIDWDTAGPVRGVALATRSGNTPRPDGSWSDWSPPCLEPGAAITSPRARYLQWRARFDGEASEGSLKGVRISYLQLNVRPRVTELTILPHGLALEKQPSMAASGFYTATAPADGQGLHAPRVRGREAQPLPPRQVLEAGARSFTWKAEDGNGDTLRYSLYLKGEAESEWKLLESGLCDTFYTLGTTALPDGTYRLKVVADDELSNPFDRSLVGERVSAPFVVAAAPPQIEILDWSVSGRRVEVRFRASVSTGVLHSAEVAVDGGPWRLLSPVDGIADSPREEYLVTTPELAAGEHRIGIRAGDRNGTTGTAGFVVAVP